MTISPIFLFLLLGISVAVSLVAGYVVAQMESRKQPSAPAAPKPMPQKPAILRVDMDASFQWQVELDGTPLHPAQMTPEQRARLVGIVVQMRPWLDAKAPPPANLLPAPPPAPVLSIPKTPTAELPKATGKIDFMRGMRTLINNEVNPTEMLKTTSIVAMIDEFLQTRLQTSPLAHKEIRLLEGEQGEVTVLLDGKRFSGVENVPDPAIQALIRAAIADWEKSA